mgnify:FL=1
MILLYYTLNGKELELMMKKSLSKSTLMVALISGSVIWGGYSIC